MNFSDIMQALAEPFAKEDVMWRPGTRSRDKKKVIALAYAESRTYEDRLNELCPDDWQVMFEPWGENRIICKMVVCGLMRSSTGEYDEDKRNAVAEGMTAEAKAFKRACSKFGLGRYFYDFPRIWVDYDDEKGKMLETPEIPARYLPKNAKPAQKPQPNPLPEKDIAIGKARADAMANELIKLGYPKGDHKRLASSILKCPVKDLEMLTSAEAAQIWNHAKQDTAT